MKKTKNITMAYAKNDEKGGFLRLIIGTLGGLCFIWFAVPLVVAGILNIGNATGMVVAVLLMAYMLFLPRVHGWAKTVWQGECGKGIMLHVKQGILGGGIALICIIGTLVVVESGCMVASCVKPAQENATAVVLGCRVYGERASQSMVERLDAAYEYLSKNPKSSCVVSGGQGKGEDISEAECMYRWLVAKGIDESRIYKEDKSTSTNENIAFSKEVIAKNDLPEEIVLISNDYHIYRAGMIAEKNGLEWGAQPGKTAWWLFPTYYVRELYGILAEWLF